MAAGGVNVNWRTSSTPHSVALPATKRQYLGSERVLRHRFGILQGSGTKRTGRTLSDSNAAESQICGAKPCVPLFTEGIKKDARRHPFTVRSHPYVGIIQIRLWVETNQFPLSRLSASSPVFIQLYNDYTLPFPFLQPKFSEISGYLPARYAALPSWYRLRPSLSMITTRGISST